MAQVRSFQRGCREAALKRCIRDIASHHSVTLDTAPIPTHPRAPLSAKIRRPWHGQHSMVSAKDALNSRVDSVP